MHCTETFRSLFKRVVRAVAWALAFAAISPAPARAQGYMIGADLSFLKQDEDRGARFKDNGHARPGMVIFKDHGYNWVRLRLFVQPTTLPNDLSYTIAMARQAKSLGMKVLLDLHYADGWADPQKQPTPLSWQDMSHAELTKAVFIYTRDIIKTFDVAGVMPDMVQVGNEVINGMLWPDGRLPDHWDRFADLIKAGIEGVKTGSGKGPVPPIMIHIDRGGDAKKTKWFFDNLLARGVAFDVIGQSYYPWWHGSLLSLRENMQFMARAYRKPIVVVEAAYNHQLTEYWDHMPPFPETPQGQKEFLEEVNRVVMATPDGLGMGVFYWEPATVSRGIQSRSMFDEAGNALPVIGVFDKFALK
jgi:arabinogalactan endo-1,4-beta-galactosidase